MLDGAHHVELDSVLVALQFIAFELPDPMLGTDTSPKGMDNVVHDTVNFGLCRDELGILASLGF